MGCRRGAAVSRWRLEAAFRVFPPVAGFRFGLFTVPPATDVLMDDLDMSAALAAMEASLPGLAAHLEPDYLGMHTTASVDYEFVISGSIVPELDDGTEVELHPGDTVIQNGTPVTRGGTRALCRARWW